MPDTHAVNSTSQNCGGYTSTAHGGGYAHVNGMFFIPTTGAGGGCDALHENATAWVGIGGASTNRLNQGGWDLFDNYDSSLAYRAWYEILPGASIFPSPAITASPGDSTYNDVVAEPVAGSPCQGHTTQAFCSVFYIEDIYTGSVLNASQGVASWDGSSADYITERFTENGQLEDLAPFGSIAWGQAYANYYGSGLSESIDNAVVATNMNMVQDVNGGPPVGWTDTLTTNSGLSHGPGTLFTTYWQQCY